ncbi:MAG: rod-binding protein [Pseudomonadota bacterium]
MSVSATTNAPTTMMPLHKTTTKEDKIKAAHDYEEMFLKFFFTNIMPKDTEGGLFGGGHSSEMYQSLWVDAAAKQTAKRGVGIAKHIIKALDRMYAEPNQMMQQGGAYDQHA